jgi:Cytochrome c biogenesis factor
LGLYCAGLIAEAHGDKAAAKSFWQKLLPLMPEGSPQRQQLEARIAAWGIEPPSLPNALGKAAPASEYSAMNYPIKAQPQLTIPAGWYHGPRSSSASGARSLPGNGNSWGRSRSWRIPAITSPPRSRAGASSSSATARGLAGLPQSLPPPGRAFHG